MFTVQLPDCFRVSPAVWRDYNERGLISSPAYDTSFFNEQSFVLDLITIRCSKHTTCFRMDVNESSRNKYQNGMQASWFSRSQQTAVTSGSGVSAVAGNHNGSLAAAGMALPAGRTMPPPRCPLHYARIVTTRTRCTRQ